MERRLGISIYPEHSIMEEDKKYIDLAKKYGFKRIFMCLLSANELIEDCLLYTSDAADEVQLV